MDAVFALGEYILQYSKSRKVMPDAFFDIGLDGYNFNKGTTLNMTSTWTGNNWVLGYPMGTLQEREKQWLQPLEWKYDIVILVAGYGRETRGMQIATWTSNNLTRNNRIGELTITKHWSPNVAVQPRVRLNQCGTIATDMPGDCKPFHLYSMAALVGIVFLCLIIVTVLHCLVLGSARAAIQDIIKSPGMVTLCLDSLSSLFISLWIIFGKEALDCDNRVDDFLVNVTNSVCYSVFLTRLLSHYVVSRLSQLCMKIAVCLLLVTLQIILAAVAHFEQVDMAGARDPVEHCYSERRKAMVMVSYWYSGLLLIGCVGLLLLSLWWRNGEYIRQSSTNKVLFGVLSVSVVIIYMVSLVFVLSVEKRSLCIDQGRFFILIAAFPSIVFVLATAVPTGLRLRQDRSNMSVLESTTGNLDMTY